MTGLQNVDNQRNRKSPPPPRAGDARRRRRIMARNVRHHASLPSHPLSIAAAHARNVGYSATLAASELAGYTVAAA